MKGRLPDRSLVLVVLIRASIFCVLTVFAISACAQSAQFQNPLMIVTPVDPVSLIAGDWNGDGHQDLIYIESSAFPALGVLLGDGKGGFVNGVTIQLPTGTCSNASSCWAVVADFNRDGKQDILTAGTFNSVPGFLVLPGNGDGTFGTPVITTFNLQNVDSFVAHPVVVADFNGDGILDIAFPTYYTNGTTVFLGDGVGGFTKGPTTQMSRGPFAAYAADLNHDGKMDLVVFEGPYGAYYANPVDVWLGNGNGGFTLSQSYPAGTNLNTSFGPIDFVDVDGDGIPDVVGITGQGSTVVLPGKADGTFGSATTIFDSSLGQYNRSAFAVADVNGDGIPDIVQPNVVGMSVRLGKGSFGFDVQQLQAFGPPVARIVIADFNEDGAADAAVPVHGGIEFLYGNRQGNFTDSNTHTTSPACTYVFAGDFTNHGLSDVACVDSGNNIWTMPSSNSGAFGSLIESSSSVSSGYRYTGNAVGDFDGDGNQDIFLAGWNGITGVQVLYGNGNGTFTPFISNGSVPDGLVADLNGDGRADIVGISQTYASSTTYSLIALLGNSNRNFTQVTTDFPDLGGVGGIVVPVILAAGDMNGDGKPDVAVYNGNIPALELWLGTGNGAFQLGSRTDISSDGLTGIGIGSWNLDSKGAIVDVDGDGKNDLVFLATQSTAANKTPTYAVVIEYGDGNGNFSARQVLSLSRAYSYIWTARLNNSARPGFVLGNSTLVATIRNLGARQYSGEELYTAGSFRNPIVADFNGDGLSDVLVNRADPDTVPPFAIAEFTILLNQNHGGVASQVNGALSVAPSTVAFDQGFTLTATLQAPQAGAPVPTGIVRFNVAGMEVGSVSLQNGVATLQVPGSVTLTLPAGAVRAVASYSGDSVYQSAAVVATLNVLEPVYPTQTTIVAKVNDTEVNSVQAASYVSFLVTVTAPKVVPSGYITLYDGTTVLGQAQPSNGTTYWGQPQPTVYEAIFSTNLLAIGVHNVSAKYQGITPLNAATFLPSTSPTIPLIVTGVGTSTSLTASASSATQGTVVTLTAKLTSANGTPIGGVSFYDSATLLGTLSLDATGSAAFSTASLGTGTHSLTAQYKANGVYADSASDVATVAVNSPAPSQQATRTVLASVSPLVGGGSQVEVRVSTQTGRADIGGGVSLILDGRLVASAKLSADGTAAMPLHITDDQLHTLQASYGGTLLSAPSVSDAFRTTMYGTASDFVLQTGRGVEQGATLTVPLRIAANGRWIDTTTLRCTGVPLGYSCEISPSMLSGPGSATLTLRPTSTRIAMAYLLFPCAAIFMLVGRQRRMNPVLITAGLLVCICACGTTKRSSSSIISVEATSGTITHSVQIVYQPPLVH